MTLAQVKTLINQWIITNGNREITAAILNPVLQAMIDWANSVIGDLSTLNTTFKGNLVGAINEVNTNLANIDLNVSNVYQGLPNPNTTPPPSYESGDFYRQVDAFNNTVALFLYDGNTWQNVTASFTPQDLENVLSVGNVSNNSDIRMQGNYSTFEKRKIFSNIDYEGLNEEFGLILSNPDFYKEGLYKKNLSNGNFAEMRFGTNGTDITLEVVVQDSTGFVGLTFIGNRGINSGIDHSAFLQDNDYTQKIYVDTALQVVSDTIPTDLSQLGDDSTHRLVTDAEIASWNAVIGGSVFQTVWNATTNSPTLASGTGAKGYYYIVSTAGSTNLDGITSWNVGDWAIFDGTVWRKVDNTDAVSSVNGITGAVSLDSSNVPDTLNKRYVTDANLVVIGNTSGTNTGDNATNSQYSGLDALKMNKPSMMKLVTAYVLANSTSLQKMFNVGSSGNGSFTASANKTYEFECGFAMTGLSSTAGTVAFGFLGTAGISGISYNAIASKGSLTAASTAMIISSQVTTIMVITSSGNPTTAKGFVKGIIVTSSAGTIIPATATSIGTGAAQVEPNSYFQIREIGADTFTATADMV